MADSIHVTRNLINQLVEDELKPKKKTKRTKPKIPRESQQSQKKEQPKQIPNAPEIQKGSPATGPGWLPQTPFFPPTPKLHPSSSTETEAIRSVLNESQSVLEKLQRLEENMSKEVTQRAKELHEKEFKLPQQKTIVCETQMKACLECYKEHVKNPLKCSSLVSGFQECVRRARKQGKVPS